MPMVEGHRRRRHHYTTQPPPPLSLVIDLDREARCSFIKNTFRWVAQSLLLSFGGSTSSKLVIVSSVQSAQEPRSATLSLSGKSLLFARSGPVQLAPLICCSMCCMSSICKRSNSSLASLTSFVLKTFQEFKVCVTLFCFSFCISAM